MTGRSLGPSRPPADQLLPAALYPTGWGHRDDNLSGPNDSRTSSVGGEEVRVPGRPVRFRVNGG